MCCYCLHFSDFKVVFFPKKNCCRLLLKKITCCAKREKKITCREEKSQTTPPPHIKWSIPYRAQKSKRKLPLIDLYARLFLKLDSIQCRQCLSH